MENFGDQFVSIDLFSTGALQESWNMLQVIKEEHKRIGKIESRFFVKYNKRVIYLAEPLSIIEGSVGKI